jgi:hypothetical protein
MGWLLGILGSSSDLIEHHIGAITAVIAAAAVVQWRETRKTAERQLRAYVLNGSASIIDGTNLDPKPFIDRTSQPGLLFEIKNFGQTPALQLVHWNEMQVSPVSREASIQPPASLQNIAPMVLGPGQTSSRYRWLDRSLSVQEIDGIKSGLYAIYVYGRIEYVDVFHTKRWSVYKLKYTNGAWPPIGPGAVSMLFCPDGNDAN